MKAATVLLQQQLKKMSYEEADVRDRLTEAVLLFSWSDISNIISGKVTNFVVQMPQTHPQIPLSENV